MKTFIVKAPATSANLGPGYDCLGLALSLFSEFEFAESGSLRIEGCPLEYQNEDNLVLKAFRKAFEAAGEQTPALHLTIRAQVPVARGLGSSSTCIAAGLFGANAFLGGRLSREQLFALATEMEGHPDNAAPCIYGGLTASFLEEGGPHMVPFSCHPDWRFVTVIPDYEVHTEEARRVVPQEISLKTGVSAVSHAIAVVRALEQGDEALLRLSARDVLHEPYRKALIRDYEAARKTALSGGAAAFLISGSGSAMLAPVLGEQKAEAVYDALKTAFPKAQTLCLRAVSEGISVKEEV